MHTKRIVYISFKSWMCSWTLLISWKRKKLLFQLKVATFAALVGWFLPFILQQKEGTLRYRTMIFFFEWRKWGRIGKITMERIRGLKQCRRKNKMKIIGATALPFEKFTLYWKIKMLVNVCGKIFILLHADTFEKSNKMLCRCRCRIVYLAVSIHFDHQKFDISLFVLFRFTQRSHLRKVLLE